MAETDVTVPAADTGSATKCECTFVERDDVPSTCDPPTDTTENNDSSGSMEFHAPVSNQPTGSAPVACPSKSCTSSKLADQWRRPCAVPARPRRSMVFRTPSPKPVRSQVRPSWPPSLWQAAQLM